MDSNTRQRTDGLFTNKLRKIIDHLHGELNWWIIFDSDVDQEHIIDLTRLRLNAKSIRLIFAFIKL